VNKVARNYYMLRVHKEKGFHGLKLGVYLGYNTIEAYWCFKPEYQKSIGSMHIVFWGDTFTELKLIKASEANNWRVDFALDDIPKPNILIGMEYYIKYRVKGDQNWRYISAGGENYYSRIGHRQLNIGNFTEDTFFISPEGLLLQDNPANDHHIF